MNPDKTPRPYLQYVLDSVVAEDRVTAHRYLTEAYQQDFGVFDHVGQAIKEAELGDSYARPLVGIEYHDSENPDPFDRFSSLLKLYDELKIKDLTGLDIDKFLKRSSLEVSLIIQYGQRKLQDAIKKDKEEKERLDAELEKLRAA